jgi:HK97 family phage portal protein
MGGGPYTSVLISDASGLAYAPVSSQTALAIDAVYAALGYYADLIGTMPVHRYRGEWERLPAPGFVDHPSGIPVGWTAEIGQVIWSLLLRGNAYLIPTSLDATGYPVTFRVADPDAVSITLRPGRLEYRLSADRYAAPSGDDVILINPAPDELLHVVWQLPPGALCGIGILDAAGQTGGTLAGAYFTERYATDLMANPIPPAVLEHPMRLDAQQARDLQAQWMDSIGRARAVPAVLSGGIKYSPLTVTAKDVELIASRKWNATAIASLFKLPPYLLGGEMGSSMTYSTVEGENQRLWTDALQPMAIRLERYIGGAWTPNGQRLRFIPDAILRSQTIDRFGAHKIALESGFETVDEVRALENLPPLELEPQPQPDVPALEPAPQPALPVGGSTL